MNVRRFDIILNLLKEKKNVTIQELMDKLNVSEATIRRDLTFLEKKEKIKRVHGGAILNEPKEENIISKKSIHSTEKEKIAKKASEFIMNNSIIYLDAGSTIEALIKYLKGKENIIVITNGITHLEELNKYEIETYLLGGEAKFITGATVGIGAILSLRTYNIDLAFLGANAISEDGYSTPDPKEAMIKNEVVKRSKKVYFLCDSSKFNKKSFINFAALDDGELITEGEIPENLKNKINLGGKK